MAASTASEMNEERKAIFAYLGSFEDDGASHQISSTTASLDRDGPSTSSNIASDAPFADANNIIPNDRNLLAAANQNSLMNLSSDKDTPSATPDNCMENTDDTKAHVSSLMSRRSGGATSIDLVPLDSEKVDDECGKVHHHKDSDAHDDTHAFKYEDNNSQTGSTRSSTYTYDQEPFETYQHKVSQLCRDIGYGKPEQIVRMQGGGYNRIIGLVPSSAQRNQGILRIPRMVLEDDEAHEIRDQVAVLLHLSQFQDLRTPKVLAYDATTNNAITSQYVLQARLAGLPLQDVFYTLPISEKLQVTTAVAEILLKFEAVSFDRPGRLVRASELPDTAERDSLSRQSRNIKVTGFREHPMEDMPTVEKQPIRQLIVTLLEHRKNQNPSWVEMIERCDRLIEVAKEMEVAGLIRASDNDSVLWHWDLSASNVLIQRDPPAAKGQSSTNSTTNGVTRELIANDGCKHTVQMKVEDEGEHGSKHSIDIQLEEPRGKGCKHRVEVVINGSSGKTYRHKLEITDSNLETHKLPEAADGTSDGKWTVSGVVDWDNVMAVPLVLSRKPPSWLWNNEEDRPSDWNQDRDIMPKRDLTHDELLIKAHFDQAMAKASSTYIEDAYHRGPWLRALAKFAIYNLVDDEIWNLYDDFIERWEEYYISLEARLAE